MKKILILAVTVVLSLIITFVAFEALSWYHFGDIPTRVVTIRLIFSFCVIEAIAVTLSAIIFRKK